MNDESPPGPRLWSNARVHGSMLPGAEAINRRILDTFADLKDEDFTRRTHFFGGRYENLYLERARIPDLAVVLGHAETCAGEILGRAPQQLRSGFWLNAQGPGQSTSEHTHDEYDELLSGVYYLSVPEGSGDILLLDGRFTVRVAPVAGMYLFFPPSLAHRVETNGSTEQRLSLAFNLGPADNDHGRA